MRTIILTRTGEPPLTFTGTEIAKATGHNSSSKRWTRIRWHELAIYRTEIGYYVGRIAYVINRAESFSTPLAWTKEAANLDELRQWFYSHRPGDYVRVFPPAERNAEREAVAVGTIGEVYFWLVEELLEKAGYTP